MQRARRGLSTSERADLWRRWKDGQSLSDIGRALGKPPGSVHGFISATGGIKPRARERSQRALSLAEREEISRGLSAGASLRSIAGRLGRSPSTVSREIKRNGGRRWYRAASADSRLLSFPFLHTHLAPNFLTAEVARMSFAQTAPSQVTDLSEVRRVALNR